MSWYNNFLATPFIGIEYASLRNEINAIESFMLNLDNDFSIKRVSLSRWMAEKRGMQINLTPGDFVFVSKYVCDINGLPGKLPNVVMPETKTYEELLEKLINLCSETWEFLDNSTRTYKNKPVNRIGIVLNTQIPIEDIPPGIENLIQSQNELWGQKLDSFDFTFITKLSDDDSSVLKCHHIAKKVIDKKNGSESIEFSLDYQEYFKDRKTFTSSALKKQLNYLQKKAVLYFENFGKRGICNE